MRTLIILLAGAVAAGSVGCKKKDAQPAGGSAASGSAMGSAADPGAGSGSGTGVNAGSAAEPAAGSGSAEGSASPTEQAAMAHKAGNCPSSVLGAKTTATVAGAAVVLTITAEDSDAVAAIQKRAEALLAEKADGVVANRHDQKGSQGGAAGLCPVFYGDGGKATSQVEAKGVKITITPKEKPEALKAAIDDRIAKTAAWVQEHIKPGDRGNEGGVGGGKGEHGSRRMGSGDGKGKERGAGSAELRQDGTGGGAGTGGGGGKGTGGGGKDDKPGK
jgi:hypothetical protein